jgi:hypothetical protein
MNGYNCNYCLDKVHEEHKTKCFLHENNVKHIKKYLIYCVINLERPSCPHMTRWINKNNVEIIQPRTLLNISNFESFDDLLYYYTEHIIKSASNIELEYLLIAKNWVSLDKKFDIDYNESLYDQELLFNSRINFIKKIIEVN